MQRKTVKIVLDYAIARRETLARRMKTPAAAMAGARLLTVLQALLFARLFV